VTDNAQPAATGGATIRMAIEDGKRCGCGHRERDHTMQKFRRCLRWRCPCQAFITDHIGPSSDTPENTPSGQ
jgi:hypothetical protein